MSSRPSVAVCTQAATHHRSDGDSPSDHKAKMSSSLRPSVNPADNYNVSSRSEWSSGNPPPGFNGQMMPGTTPADNYNVNSSTSWSSGNPPPNFNPNAPFGGSVFG
ncbi:unnamed protein product, partial [Mesorhabditis spiculigera]